MNAITRFLLAACALSFSACSDEGPDISATGTVGGVPVSFTQVEEYWTTDEDHQIFLRTADGTDSIRLSVARSAPYGTHACTTTAGPIEYGAFVELDGGPLYASVYVPDGMECDFFISDAGGDGNGIIEFQISGVFGTNEGALQSVDLTVTMRGVN